MSYQVPEKARQEIKFVANYKEYYRILNWLKLHNACFQKAYPDRWVNNIYFDTINYNSYTTNLSGESSRTKIRYRWYGKQENPAAGTLEIKRKRNVFSWKLLFEVPSAPYKENATWRTIKTLLLEQLPEAGKMWLESNPFPIIINRYYRKYFVSFDQKIRVTIDTNISVFDQRYKPYPNLSNSIDLSHIMIVEEKFDRKDRELASMCMQGIPIRVGRHSKYMTGVNAVSGNGLLL